MLTKQDRDELNWRLLSTSVYDKEPTPELMRRLARNAKIIANSYPFDKLMERRYRNQEENYLRIATLLEKEHASQ